MRYKVLYSKQGFPAVRFFDSLELAKTFTLKMEKYGYTSWIWQEYSNGARLILRVE